MTTITAQININASKSAVWQVLGDPGEIHRFHPLVKSSKMTTNIRHGQGARRHCTLHPMGEMEEIISDWKSEEQYTTELVSGRMLPPLEVMIGTVSLDSDGQDTKVRFTLTYRLKYGILGRILNVLFIKPQFGRAPDKYVTGLKEYVEKQIN